MRGRSIAERSDDRPPLHCGRIRRGLALPGKQGYFNFYCPREERAVQFAEGDALTWHAGEWNDQGPGSETGTDRDDSVAYTDHQLDDLGRIAHWLHDRYGIPLDRFYDTGGDNGARRSEGSTAGLCITHRSLAQSGGWHSDYLTADEWKRAIRTTAPTPIEEDEDMGALLVTLPGEGQSIWVVSGPVRHPLDGSNAPETINEMLRTGQLRDARSRRRRADALVVVRYPRVGGALVEGGRPTGEIVVLVFSIALALVLVVGRDGRDRPRRDPRARARYEHRAHRDRRRRLRAPRTRDRLRRGTPAETSRITASLWPSKATEEPGRY